MTEAATRFVGPSSFEGITGAPVLIDEFERDPMRGAYPGEPLPDHDPIGHLAVAQNADVFCVAPASANTIAKLAAGIADGMLTTAFLATTAARLVAPAMNDRMYRDAATQANLDVLRGRGVTVIEPDSGALASRGEEGVGRLPDPARLLAHCEALAGGSGAWEGLRVLVTAGGTREPLDPVRFIGNRSSGRMGLALARAAVRLGADVTLIAANVALEAPPGVARIDVETAAKLAEATEASFRETDILFMAAAVADFRPVGPGSEKISREGSEGLIVELTENPDVVAGLASGRRPDQTIVGFAAEHGGDWIARAQRKLERKGLDAIVANDVSRPEIGFESTDNEVTFVTADAAEPVTLAGKDRVADAICELTASLRARKRSSV
jgi:phosphopantothenoylcysteine decarboxylase/phosphopantothenate--cysteine ligase